MKRYVLRGPDNVMRGDFTAEFMRDIAMNPGKWRPFRYADSTRAERCFELDDNIGFTDPKGNKFFFWKDDRFVEEDV